LSVGIEELGARTDVSLDVLLSRADGALYEKKRRRA
jgi:PleD family two-component response regulator